MFYKSVEAGWKAGKVRIGLPAVGHGDRITIEASGLLGLKVVFLSDAERQELAELSKADALAARASQTK